MFTAAACIANCGGESPNEAVAKLEASGDLPSLDRSSSLAGPDANGNGIRDDIDSWIQRHMASAAQKAALAQGARATQRTLTVDVGNEAALRAVVVEQHAAIKCAVRRGVASTDLMTLQGLTANTKERASAYMKYNEALDGSVVESPEGDGCAA